MFSFFFTGLNVRSIIRLIRKTRNEIKINQEEVMAAIDELNQSVTELQTESTAITEKLAALFAKIKELEDAIAAGTNDQAILDAAAAVRAEIAKLHTAANPV